MTKNEIELLEDWIKYHGYLFGLENIHVIDGSDDVRIFAIYDKYIPLGLNVHYSDTGLNGLAAELTQLMKAHGGSGNFLIKLDNDEFLAYTKPANISPRNLMSSVLQKMYLARYHRKLRKRSSRVIKALVNKMHARKEIAVANFEQFFAALPVTGQRYKCSLTVLSYPLDKPVTKPCRELTEFTPLLFTHEKTFFHSDSFVEVDLGSHSGKSTNDAGVIDTGLTLIHYHCTCVEDSVRRARQVLVSHEYINAEDSIEQQHKKLTQLSSRKVRSNHKVRSYLHYLDLIAGNKTINPMIFNGPVKKFGKQKPQQMTVVRDTLDAIDRQKIY